MSSKNIVVLGSLHYDIFIESDKIPEVGETVLGKKWYPKLGGKGANQAVALVKENINVNFVSAVGNDDFANYLINQLSKNNISDKFLFCGFFSEKKQQLSNQLKKLSEFENSLVFFISPKKINKIIPAIKKNFTGRKIVICREITKIYEEFIRKNIDELETFEKEPKGELTVVISEKKINKIISEKLTESDKSIIKKMINK